YPINVLLWARLVRYFVISAADGFQFIAIIQEMNAVAADGCLVVFYVLCRVIGAGALRSVCLTLGYGASAAILLHATNSAEPMAGLFWNFASAAGACLSLRMDRRGLAFAAGFFSTLAMATHQSMVLAAPAIFLLLLLWPDSGGATAGKARLRWAQAIAFACGVTIGMFSVYGLTYRHF